MPFVSWRETGGYPVKELNCRYKTDGSLHAARKEERNKLSSGK